MRFIFPVFIEWGWHLFFVRVIAPSPPSLQKKKKIVKGHALPKIINISPKPTPSGCRSLGPCCLPLCVGRSWLIPPPKKGRQISNLSWRKEVRKAQKLPEKLVQKFFAWGIVWQLSATKGPSFGGGARWRVLGLASGPKLACLAL